MERLSDERRRLVEQNLGLVFSQVRPHLRRHVERDDLVSAGFMALTLAAQRFDPDKGCQFSTYATHYIHFGMLAVLNDRRHLQTSHEALDPIGLVLAREMEPADELIFREGLADPPRRRQGWREAFAG